MSSVNENNRGHVFFLSLSLSPHPPAVHTTRFSPDAKKKKTETLSDDLRCSRVDVQASQRREAAALSELARYDTNNARRVEQVQALLAAAACTNAEGLDASRSDQGAGRAMGAGSGSTRPVRVGGAAAGELSDLAALGEAIADRAREIADLKVSPAAIC